MEGAFPAINFRIAGAFLANRFPILRFAPNRCIFGGQGCSPRSGATAPLSAKFGWNSGATVFRLQFL